MARTIELTTTQQRLIREVEARHVRELNEVLQLIQDELGFEPENEENVFMLNGERSAFVEMEKKNGKGSGKDTKQKATG